MIKLSRKMEYALIALKHLSVAEQLTPAKELSHRYQIPFDVVSRVLQVLNQNDVVKSAQGIHGGYKLIKPLNSVTFYELAEMIEGPLYLVKCLQGDCDMKRTCNITNPLQILNQKISLYFKTILVSDLLVDSFVDIVEKTPLRTSLSMEKMEL